MKGLITLASACLSPTLSFAQAWGAPQLHRRLINMIPLGPVFFSMRLYSVCSGCCPLICHVLKERSSFYAYNGPVLSAHGPYEVSPTRHEQRTCPTLVSPLTYTSDRVPVLAPEVRARGQELRPLWLTPALLTRHAWK